VTVVTRLGAAVCEVNSFTEHVTSYWSLGRSDSKALRKDTNEVARSGAVPQKLLVVHGFELGVEINCFDGALNFKYLKHFVCVIVMSRSLGIQYISKRGSIMLANKIKGGGGMQRTSR
jgi:hypothetical protein